MDHKVHQGLGSAQLYSLIYNLPPKTKTLLMIPSTDPMCVCMCVCVSCSLASKSL